MTIIRFIRYGVISCFMLVFLTACSSLETTPVDAEKTQLPETWSIRGRISVVTEQDNWYAGFNWLQRKDDFRIRFTGPMGQTELELSKQNQLITLKTPSYERQSTNLEQLLSQEMGRFIPVKSLRYWVAGIADAEILNISFQLAADIACLEAFNSSRFKTDFVPSFSANSAERIDSSNLRLSGARRRKIVRVTARATNKSIAARMGSIRLPLPSIIGSRIGLLCLYRQEHR